MDKEFIIMVLRYVIPGVCLVVMVGLGVLFVKGRGE